MALTHAVRSSLVGAPNTSSKSYSAAHHETLKGNKLRAYISATTGMWCLPPPLGFWYGLHTALHRLRGRSPFASGRLCSSCSWKVDPCTTTQTLRLACNGTIPLNVTFARTTWSHPVKSPEGSSAFRSGRVSMGRATTTLTVGRFLSAMTSAALLPFSAAPSTARSTSPAASCASSIAVPPPLRYSTTFISLSTTPNESENPVSCLRVTDLGSTPLRSCTVTSSTEPSHEVTYLVSCSLHRAIRSTSRAASARFTSSSHSSSIDENLLSIAASVRFTASCRLLVRPASIDRAWCVAALSSRKASFDVEVSLASTASKPAVASTSADSLSSSDFCSACCSLSCRARHASDAWSVGGSVDASQISASASSFSLDSRSTFSTAAAERSSDSLRSAACTPRRRATCSRTIAATLRASRRRANFWTESAALPRAARRGRSSCCSSSLRMKTLVRPTWMLRLENHSFTLLPAATLMRLLQMADSPSFSERRAGWSKAMQRYLRMNSFITNLAGYPTRLISTTACTPWYLIWLATNLPLNASGCFVKFGFMHRMKCW
mmetsp:Transcript_42802/g.103986  ORF Transcript_42802/g.103986 Transcript_42802/m.103986 type:complete len:550 (-) Transcript_42802:114-1763(-)